MWSELEMNKMVIYDCKCACVVVYGGIMIRVAIYMLRNILQTYSVVEYKYLLRILTLWSRIYVWSVRQLIWLLD